MGADSMYKYMRHEYGQTSSPRHRCWSSKCKSGTKKRAGLVLVLGMLLFLDGVEWLGWLGIRTTQPPLPLPLPSSDMGCLSLSKSIGPLYRYPSTYFTQSPSCCCTVLIPFVPGSPYAQSTKGKRGASSPTPSQHPYWPVGFAGNVLVPPSLR